MSPGNQAAREGLSSCGGEGPYNIYAEGLYWLQEVTVKYLTPRAVA